MKTICFVLHDYHEAVIEEAKQRRNEFEQVREVAPLVPIDMAMATSRSIDADKHLARIVLERLDTAESQMLFYAARLVYLRWLEVAENLSERKPRRRIAANAVIEMVHSGNFDPILMSDWERNEQSEYATRASKVLKALSLEDQQVGW